MNMSLPRRRTPFLSVDGRCRVLIGLSAPAGAAETDLKFPAFAQAVAEAALGHDEVAAFYRETGYAAGLDRRQTAAERARLTALLQGDSACRRPRPADVGL